MIITVCAVVACGGGPGPPATRSQVPASIAVAAADSVLEAATGSFTYTASIAEVGGLPDGVVAVIVGRYDVDQRMMAAEMSFPMFSDAGARTLHVFLREDVIMLRAGAGEWREVNVADVTSAAGWIVDGGVVPLLGLVYRAEGLAADQGMDGERRHLRLLVEAVDVLPLLPTGQRELVQAIVLENAAVLDEVPIGLDVWIGADGRLARARIDAGTVVRRVHERLDALPEELKDWRRASTIYELELNDVGADITIVPPTPAS